MSELKEQLQRIEEKIDTIGNMLAVLGLITLASNTDDDDEVRVIPNERIVI